MARRKTSYKRRRRTSRRTRGKKYIARVAQSVINRNLELKDRVWSPTSCGYNEPSASAESFTNIGYGNNSKICKFAESLSQGYNDGEFTGHGFNIKGLHIHFALGDPLLTTYATPAIRFILFRPKGRQGVNWNTNGDLIKQLLSNSSPSGSQYLEPIDTDYFKVYWQKTVYIPVHYNPASAGSVSYTPKVVNKFLKFPGRGLKVEYDGGANNLTNDIYLAAVSSIGVAPYVNVIAGTVKIYYTDP